MLGRLLQRDAVRTGGIGSMSWTDYMELFSYNGSQYLVPGAGTAQMTAQQGSRNPVVMRCMVIRGSVFSQIEFQYKRKSDKKLFGTQALQLLEEPWPLAGTAELLIRVDFDVSRYGNSYWYIQPPSIGRPFGTLVWLDPTEVNIITGDVDGPSGKMVGKYLLGYQTKDHAGQPGETFLPSEIVHVRPIPDPTHPFRGQSWLSSLLPDIVADQDLTNFKHAFVQNAATPNLVVTFPQGPDGRSSIGKEAFSKFREKMEATHTGASQAFKTLYIGGGADVKTVGSNFEDMMLSVTQAHGELRLCMAGGVPPNLVGVAEGLKGSTLNTANFLVTGRSFADITIRPLWKHACKAFETAVGQPTGSKLWYDPTEVDFLQADLMDAAKQQQANAGSMLTLINAGYEPDSVTTAIVNGDLSQLTHTGFVSVQLQEPGATGPPVDNQPQPSDQTNNSHRPVHVEVHTAPIEVHPPAIELHSSAVEVHPPVVEIQATRSDDHEVLVEALKAIQPPPLVTKPMRRRTEFIKNAEGEITGKVETEEDA